MHDEKYFSGISSITLSSILPYQLIPMKRIISKIHTFPYSSEKLNFTFRSFQLSKLLLINLCPRRFQRDSLTYTFLTKVNQIRSSVTQIYKSTGRNSEKSLDCKTNSHVYKYIDTFFRRSQCRGKCTHPINRLHRGSNHEVHVIITIVT